MCNSDATALYFFIIWRRFTPQSSCFLSLCWSVWYFNRLPLGWWPSGWNTIDTFRSDGVLYQTLDWGGYQHYTAAARLSWREGHLHPRMQQDRFSYQVERLYVWQCHYSKEGSSLLVVSRCGNYHMISFSFTFFMQHYPVFIVSCIFILFFMTISQVDQTLSSYLKALC